MKKGLLIICMILLFFTSFATMNTVHASNLPAGIVQPSSLPVSESSTLDVNKINKNGKAVFTLSPVIKQELERIKSLFTEMAKALNSILIWDQDDKTIQLIKPNVQMLFALEVGTDDKDVPYIKRPFSKVTKGEPLKQFFVYVEIDKIPDEEVEFQLIMEPHQQSKGKEKVSPVIIDSFNNVDKDRFRTSRNVSFIVENVNFNEAGSYTFKLQMKFADTNKAGDLFYTIAEKEMRVE